MGCVMRLLIHEAFNISFPMIKCCVVWGVKSKGRERMGERGCFTDPSLVENGFIERILI